MTCYSIESDLSRVRELADVFKRFSIEEQLGDKLTGQLELMLVEAVNNVIEHAYEMQQGFIVNTRFEASKTEVMLTITDYGLPVPLSPIAKGKAMDVTELPEGGWGLHLIYTLADDVKHFTVDGLNTMVLTKNRIID
jgi:serine/threonine-protein kinase RsbW